MKRENLHQPFEISFSELDESLLKEHEHTFFELVYILSGTGIQWINNNMFPYHDGHLFMEVTKIVYFIGNEHMLIAHDSNRLRF
ncbi:AraC family ligand binding domain-containing protein, partial [Phocaeicola vulgatus]|uniref:AraC family ligand binding domain-containing protein n=1 Tax=Phocaeicola vulgatus TaxID=821 RepID=UPI001E48F730